MKNFKLLIVSLLLIGFLASCNKDDEMTQEASSEELIFGHYFGECWGETCVEIFKLTEDKLFEDRSDGYAGGGTLEFEELTSAQFDQVKELKEDFPVELLQETETTFGCPDCGDWGGYYISWKDETGTYEWQVDMIRESVPSYLHSFLDQVDEKIALLQ